MFVDIIIFILIGLFIRIIITSFDIPIEKIDVFRDKVNKIVFYYIIPIVCFKTTYLMPFSINHFKISLVANLTIISCVIVSLIIYKKIASIKGVSPKVIGSLIMCSAFGNVLYIGLPILTKLYGIEGMSYAFTYDFLASTPLTWTLAVAVCMKYGRVGKISLKDSIFTIIRIPPIWGLILGLLFRELSISISDELINLMNLLSKYITFLMLIIVGISIKAVAPDRFKILLPAIIVKIIMSPIFALFYGSIFNLSGIPLNVCIVESVMPSMLLSMIFASAFGVDMRTAIEMIFLTTVFSLFVTFILIKFFI